ncbi:type IV pilin protein [Kingella negevensis]|uniref:type IV pilin protein n=1 Tax=Kingella negevensis TaxID=1522312 RepID=UPI002543C748|nr:type IV pilin protein [Kingella negevensis]MDK4697655.1 type IV pilin protein [Kingella negevensis]WII92956.1 type IV pilin protein [Kingella negevensis]
MKQKQLGMSLVELMVVIIIIGILAAVAMPQYQSYVEKTRLAEAKQQLLTIKQEIEAQKLTNPRGLDIGNAAQDSINNITNQYYTLARTVDGSRLFLQASPKQPTYKYGIWMDNSGTTYKCKNLTGAARTNQPSNCEVI